MKYILILFAGFLCYSHTTYAQNSSDCKKILQLSTENISAIFDALPDQSIHGNEIKMDTWHSNICLEGQINTAEVIKGSVGTNVKYILLEPTSKEEVVNLYNDLKKQLKMIKPSELFEEFKTVWKKGGDGDYGIGDAYTFQDKKDHRITGKGKLIIISYYNPFTGYSVEMMFHIG